MPPSVGCSPVLAEAGGPAGTLHHCRPTQITRPGTSKHLTLGRISALISILCRHLHCNICSECSLWFYVMRDVPAPCKGATVQSTLYYQLAHNLTPITMSVVCTQILPLVDWSISRLVSQFKCQSVSCLLVGCLLVGCLLVGCLLVGCLSVGCLL